MDTLVSKYSLEDYIMSVVASISTSASTKYWLFCAAVPRVIGKSTIKFKHLNNTVLKQDNKYKHFGLSEFTPRKYYALLFYLEC